MLTAFNTSDVANASATITAWSLVAISVSAPPSTEYLICTKAEPVPSRTTFAVPLPLIVRIVTVAEPATDAPASVLSNCDR